MGLLDDYSSQAIAYDRTRGVSRPVLGPMLGALSAACGPWLIDIGGGTGNYAAEARNRGFEPLVVESALKEARRVLAPRGLMAAMVFTRKRRRGALGARAAPVVATLVPSHPPPAI